LKKAKTEGFTVLASV